jgi:hypothetical protein
MNHAHTCPECRKFYFCDRDECVGKEIFSCKPCETKLIREIEQRRHWREMKNKKP